MTGFAAGNAQHIGAREQQQDSFGFSDPSDQAFVAHGGFLGIVADGVGGLTHGSQASQSAVSAFLQAYHLKSPGESIPDALARSLHQANAAVLGVASEPSAQGAGTTLAAAVLHSSSLYWISAGDSRIYLLHAGQLTRITSDHTYARDLDDQSAQGKISRAEAQNNPERGSLTSYLGQAEPKVVDRNTRPLALAQDDRVIICSDGFYRALDDLEIVGAFSRDLQKGCELSVGQILAKQRQGQDNLTVIALKQRSIRRLVPGMPTDVRSRLLVYASAFVILALLCALGYRYDKRRASSLQPGNPATVAPAQAAGAPAAVKPAASQADGNSTPATAEQHDASTKTPTLEPKQPTADSKRQAVDAKQPHTQRSANKQPHGKTRTNKPKGPTAVKKDTRETVGKTPNQAVAPTSEPGSGSPAATVPAIPPPAGATSPNQPSGTAAETPPSATPNNQPASPASDAPPNPSQPGVKQPNPSPSPAAPSNPASPPPDQHAPSSTDPKQDSPPNMALRPINSAMSQSQTNAFAPSNWIGRLE